MFGNMTRRDMLAQTSTGFGSVALASLMAEQAGAKVIGNRKKAKNVIFLYMSGPTAGSPADPSQSHATTRRHRCRPSR